MKIMTVTFNVLCDYKNDVYLIRATQSMFDHYNRICLSISDLMSDMLDIQKELRGRYKVTFKFK